MNKKKLLARTLVSVLACTTAACSSDIEQKESPVQGERITVSATAGMPQNQPSTRLDFGDTSANDKLTITWRPANDPKGAETFSVLNGTPGTTPSTFTLQSVDASDAHNASFEGEITPADGATYYAVYPALPAAATAPATAIPLDMTKQTGVALDESKVYMYSSSAYTAGGALNFNFNHLTAILKVTMNFPTEAGSTLPDMDITPLTRSLSGAAMTDVTFSADAGLYTSANVDITAATATYSGQVSGSLTPSGPFTLTPGVKPSAPSRRMCHPPFPEYQDFKIRLYSSAYNACDYQILKSLYSIQSDYKSD